MAVTRIKNNQITDSTITYQKIASGTLVGSLFNANLTLNSNVSIVGNLTIAGNTTTVNSIDTLVSDSLITLNNGYVGVPAYDVGILFNRALGTLDNYGGVNAALVWSESDGAFIAVLTTETGTTAGTINRAFKANLIAGNITAANAILAQSATITTLNVTNTNVSGLTSTGNIVAASGTAATNYTTGALVVPGGGGVGITGALYVQGQSTFLGNINAGNIQLSGNINVPVGGTFSNTGVFYGNAGGIGALYAGTTLYTQLPTTVLQMTGSVDSYAQVNFQNYSNGTSASTDYVATADNGSDADGYINLGINSSNFNDANYPNFFPNDGYLIHHGINGAGNLTIMTHEEETAIKFHVGAFGQANVRAAITSAGLRVNTSTASTSTTSGALLVDGGIGIKGNIHAVAINNTPIGNTTPNTGNFTTLTATNSSTTTAVVTNLSTGNIVVSGGYISSLTNATITTGTITNLSSTSAEATTLVATNFSTANAIINGGNINLQVGPPNFNSWVIADHVEAYFSFFGNVNAANLYASSGNLINFTKIETTTANIYGGYADGFKIGPNVQTTGNFTTLGAIDVSSTNLNAVSGFVTTLSADIFTANYIGSSTLTGNLISSNVNLTGGSINNTTVGAINPSTGAFTSLTANSNVTITSSQESGSSSSGALVVTGGVGVGANLNVGGNLVVQGNFVVQGELTTLNVATLDVEDKNITIAKGVGSALSADGAGITIDGANATITYANADDSFNFNKLVNITNGNIAVLYASNFSTANLNVVAGNILTGYITNFSTANARITGGFADNFPIGANTASTGNFTTANATSFTSYNATVTTINSTTGNITTLNATAVNSDAATIVTFNSTSGNLTTLVSTNFGTANARITGGYADNFPIGANTAAPGYFTNLEASNSTKTAILNVTSNVYLSPQSGAGLVTINPLNVGTIDNMSIGQTNAANVYASNFRAATSLWAATSGPVWIRGGTGTSGINNIPIGAVTPSTGAFTVADIATGNITTLNNFAGNTTTLVATNFSTGNVVVSGGYISALTNAYITTSLITNFSTANARITGGYADNFPIGANTAAPGVFTTLTAASLNNTVIGNATPAAGTFTNLSATGNLTLATGNIVISSGNTTVYTAAAGTANTTGALIITGTGGAAINGNMYVGQGVVINGNRTSNDTIVRGVNERSLLYIAADTTYDQISIGGNITTANITQGAKLVINSTDALVLPVGTSAQRPGSSGFTDVDGMIRFNSTTNQLEFYGDGQWNTTGSSFTVITSRTFANSSGDINGNVDGTNTQFVLGSESTTAATLIAINGVIQIPTTAYSVTGNTITFTEAPAVGDVVDTRIITTTSTVTGVASLDGFNQFQTDATGLRFYTGNVALGTVENWRIDTHGDFYPVTTANLGAPTHRVDYIYASNININGTITGASLSSGSLDDTIIGANIARAGSFTTLSADSTFSTNALHATDDLRGKFVAPGGTDAVYGFPTSTYRSGKFFVQLSDSGGGEYQSAEVIAVHNGTTCSIEVYAVTYTGSANLATFSCNIAGGTAYLNASSAGANLAIKVTPTLMKI